MLLSKERESEKNTNYRLFDKHRNSVGLAELNEFSHIIQVAHKIHNEQICDQFDVKKTVFLSQFFFCFSFVGLFVCLIQYCPGYK